MYGLFLLFCAMRLALHHKTKQILWLLLKLGVVVLAVWFIHFRLTHNNRLDFTVFTHVLKSQLYPQQGWVFLLALLSLINWYFEIKKWQVLVSAEKKISFKTAAKQSLIALSASIFTPNRIGEFGVKPLFFDKNLRVHIFFLTFLHHFLQLLVTLLLGGIAAFLFISVFNFEIYPNEKRTLLIAALFALALLGFIVWKRDKQLFGFSLSKAFAYLAKNLALVQKAFLFSFLKYVVFAHQFYGLALLFKPGLDYYLTMVIIGVMYLLSSLLPVLSALEMLVKGSIAILLFGFLGMDEIPILCVVTLMWLLNVCLPALLGGYLLLKTTLSHKKVR